MDELTAALAGSFEISNDPNKTSAPHPRFSQFKSKNSKQDQDSRRKRLLEIQKKNRFDFTNHVRKLMEDDWKDEEDEDDDDSGMDVEVKIKRPGRYYKDQLMLSEWLVELMLSEWLVEVPEDFIEEWSMVVCPVGRRTLVVTNGSTTRAYAKNGKCVRSFPSLLPGGCRRKSKYRNSTILDCVYNELDKTYYVLDLMCWNGHSIYETETEFRFYWLHDKFQETDAKLDEISNINPFKFVPLPSFPCTPESITSAIGAANFEMDGVLFYHKRAHYMFGSSPLVVWLKPYMLTEILGVSVPEHHMTHRPPTYTTYASHMEQVGANKTKDTDITRRDYKAYGHARRPGRLSQSNEQEMREEGGQGGGGDVNADSAAATREGVEATQKTDSGDMESEVTPGSHK
ncbi:hypothetical protein ACOMHN_022826 [Nucella lapillus]